MAAGDHLAQTDLVGHVGEHLAQGFAVTSVGRGGQPANGSLRILGQHLVNDHPVAGRGRVVRLIDDQ